LVELRRCLIQAGFVKYVAEPASIKTLQELIVCSIYTCSDRFFFPVAFIYKKSPFH